MAGTAADVRKASRTPAKTAFILVGSSVSRSFPMEDKTKKRHSICDFQKRTSILGIVS